MNNELTLLRRASDVWLEAGRLLHFRVQAPYAVIVNSEHIECIAFLPDYGSPNGSIVSFFDNETYHRDDRITEYAKRNKMFHSFVNPMGFQVYDEIFVKRLLMDWGYFGADEWVPEWLKIAYLKP